MDSDRAGRGPDKPPGRLSEWLHANVELVVIGLLLVALAGYVAFLSGSPAGWLS
jgi:hypothetical protein